MKGRRIMGVQGVGSVIREERLNQGLTQAQLAAKARVSREWLSGVERGERLGAELSKVLTVLSVLDLDVFLSSRVSSDAPLQAETVPHSHPAQDQFPITMDEVTREAIKAMASTSWSDQRAVKGLSSVAEFLSRRVAARSPTASESLQNLLRQAKDQGGQS